MNGENATMNNDGESNNTNEKQVKVRVVKNTNKEKKASTKKGQTPMMEAKKRGRPAGSGVKSQAKATIKKGPGRPATKIKTTTKAAKKPGRPASPQKTAKANQIAMPGKLNQSAMIQFWKDVEKAAKNARKTVRNNTKKASNS